MGQYTLRNEEKAKKKGVGSDVPDLIGGDSQEHPEGSSLVRGSLNQSRDHDTVGRVTTLPHHSKRVAGSAHRSGKNGPVELGRSVGRGTRVPRSRGSVV